LTIEPLVVDGLAVPVQVSEAKGLFAKGWNLDRAQAEAAWPQVSEDVRDHFLREVSKRYA